MIRFGSLLLFLCFLLSCKKETPVVEYLPEPKMPAIPFYHFENSDATLQATHYCTLVDSGVVGTLTYIQGIAMADLRTITGQPTSPKSIVAEGASLKASKGIFATDPGNSQGLDFGSIVEWSVTGRNTIPDFTEQIQDRVPEIGDVNVEDSISTNEVLKLIIDFQNPYTRIGTPDSINYRIVGKKSVLQKKGTTADTAVFEVSDLQLLGSGKAYLQVEAFRWHEREYSGYEVTFVNKGVFTKAIWVY